MNWLPSLRAVLIFAGLMAILAAAYWACSRRSNVRVSGHAGAVVLRGPMRLPVPNWNPLSQFGH